MRKIPKKLPKSIRKQMMTSNRRKRMRKNKLKKTWKKEYNRPKKIIEKNRKLVRLIERKKNKSWKNGKKKNARI